MATAAHPSSRSSPRRVLILGSTGSIGTQAIDVVRHVNALADAGHDVPRLEVVGLAARSRAGPLLEQAASLGVRDAAIADDDAVRTTGLRIPDGIRLRQGPDAAERLVREVACDVVLAAMVGIAGLPATLAAIDLGRDVALANKETLVAAGQIVIPAARRSGARLLPVDSEHSGVWQCLVGRDAPGQASNDERADPATSARGLERQGTPSAIDPVPPLVCAPHIARVILTASGGPFRTWSRQALADATPEQALRHPTWTMGPKVTIDSASLMNKGLELIEAHWLFGLEAQRLGVLIHPQSVIHAIVEHADGSMIAQMGSPDMRTPIMVALAWPHRAAAPAPRLDFARARSLDLEPVDDQRFPAVGLAMRAIAAGGTAGAVLNGANEEAVLAFLRGREDPARGIPFARITDLVAQALERVGSSPIRSLADVLEADAAARRVVRHAIAP